jgi:hypothetical protein
LPVNLWLIDRRQAPHDGFNGRGLLRAHPALDVDKPLLLEPLAAAMLLLGVSESHESSLQQ